VASVRPRGRVLTLLIHPNVRANRSRSQGEKSWTGCTKKTAFYAKRVNRKIFRAPRRTAVSGATHCFSESISRSRN
jgi:hypothetical protein